jgi:isoquinoline 1-oxidoreductase alpha subunit
MTKLWINGCERDVTIPGDAPLLWALRDELGLTGTKFGCGRGLCGACTVHIAGEAARSCAIMVGEVGDRAVTTIEGLSGPVAKAVQDAWVRESVPQCGYCQPGFVMALESVLRHREEPSKTVDEVLGQITNLCRCGTYDAIRTAVGRALETLSTSRPEPPRLPQECKQ